MTNRENIVPCPACGERIDAVDVICETGACPECRVPFQGTSDHPDTNNEGDDLRDYSDGTNDAEPPTVEYPFDGPGGVREGES